MTFQYTLCYVTVWIIYTDCTIHVKIVNIRLMVFNQQINTECRKYQYIASLNQKLCEEFMIKIEDKKIKKEWLKKKFQG